MSERLKPVVDGAFLAAAARQADIELDALREGSMQRGTTVVVGKTITIALREGMKEERRAFTLAHELGHVALIGHLLPGPGGKWPLHEREPQADLWAARTLLGPAATVDDAIAYTLQQYDGPKEFSTALLYGFARAPEFLAAIKPEIWLADRRPADARELQGLIYEPPGEQ